MLFLPTSNLIHPHGTLRIPERSGAVKMRLGLPAQSLTSPTFRIPLGIGLPFVVAFLTLSQGQFNLAFAPGEIKAGGDQGIALFPGLAQQAPDLPLVQQELAEP